MKKFPQVRAIDLTDFLLILPVDRVRSINFPPNLRKLNLKQPQLSDDALHEILLKCPQIEELGLIGTTSLTSRGWQELTTLTSLRALNISESSIDLPILKSILTCCPNITELNLSTRYLRPEILRRSDFLEIIPLCINLKKFTANCSSNGFTNDCLRALLNSCKSLQFLHVAGCGVVGNFLLERPYDKHSVIKTEGEGSVALPKELHTLNIRNTALYRVALQIFLEKCPNLRNVDCRNCDGLSPREMAQLPPQSSVEVLFFGGQEKKLIPYDVRDVNRVFTRFPNLREVGLDLRSLTSEEIAEIQFPPSIRRIWVLNEMELKSLKHIINSCPELTEVVFDGYKSITDPPSLRALDFPAKFLELFPHLKFTLSE